MNKQELISKLRAAGQDAALQTICHRAAEVLENTQGVKIVIGEDGLSVDHFVKIAERRFSRLNGLGKQVAGLEESLKSIKPLKGNLKAAYAETGDVMIQFWLGDGNVLVGCVIGTSRKPEWFDPAR